MPKVELKSVLDVKAKLRDLLHRAATRYVEGQLVPKPENCSHAQKLGNKVQPCATCGARPGEGCRIESQFESRYTFPELKMMFRDLVEKREWLLREHRDIAMLLWVLNQLGPTEEPGPDPLPAQLMKDPGDPDPPFWVRLEGDVLQLSPAAASAFSTILIDFMKQGANDQVLEKRTLGKQTGDPA